MPLRSASEFLRNDHRELEEVLDRISHRFQHITPESAPALRSDAGQISRLLATHFRLEEGIVYPVLRGRWPDLLAQMDEQHAAVRELETHVTELLSPGNEWTAPRWAADVRAGCGEWVDLIQHHIVAEEDFLFRLVDNQLSPAEQEQLLGALARTASEKGTDVSVGMHSEPG